MKNIIFAILILIVLFGLIQLIPYGRNHNNPVVVSEPIWDSPATRVLAKNACFDCHSNEIDLAAICKHSAYFLAGL